MTEQGKRVARRFVRRLRLHLESVNALGAAARFLFKLVGVYEVGVRNALDVQVRSLELPFPDLPRSFDGYRILHLSDLHIDGLDGLTEVLLDKLSGLEVDLAVVTGDYRSRFHGDGSEAIRRLERLVPAIRARDGVLGVQGNHDDPDFLPAVEGTGIRLLRNASVRLERGNDAIWVAGVDDPHLYEAADLDSALEGVPEETFVVLLAHSPELYREAARRGVRLYLCGHTHGGQIHLPRIGPVFLNARVPRRYGAGLWREGGMWGYTTFGAGSTAVPVRLGCRPEIVVITLRAGHSGVPTKEGMVAPSWSSGAISDGDALTTVG